MSEAILSYKLSPDFLLVMQSQSQSQCMKLHYYFHASSVKIFVKMQSQCESVSCPSALLTVDWVPEEPWWSTGAPCRDRRGGWTWGSQTASKEPTLQTVWQSDSQTIRLSDSQTECLSATIFKTSRRLYFTVISHRLVGQFGPILRGLTSDSAHFFW